MKAFIILLLSVAMLVPACAAIKDLTDGENMEIANASFENTEEGSKLAVAVRFWPDEEDGYTPRFFVFDKKKSTSAKITMKDGYLVVMNAVVNNSTAEKINVSDRLVFTRPNGEVGFLKIEEWQNLGN